MHMPRNKRPLPAAILLLVAIPAWSQGDNAGDLLSVDDVMALRWTSEPSISPRGEWIAYTVYRHDMEADEPSTQLFMVSADGSEVLQLTADDYSASTPRWSPGGRYIGFLAAKGDEDEPATQVWTLDTRGGDAQPYTAIDQGVEDFLWSPDGTRMLLVIRDKSANDLAKEAAEEAGKEAKPLPFVIDRLQFKRDGVPYLDRSRTHLYIVDGRVVEPLQLTFGDYDDAEPAFSHDGSVIAFTSNRTDEPDSNSNSDIWVVSALGDEAGRTARRLTSNPGTDYSPAWSNDGKSIAYVSVTEPDLIWYATNHLAIVPAAGGEETVLTRELDRNVLSPRFAPDDRSILFLLEDSAEQQLARFVLRSGRVERLVRGELAIYEYSLDDSGNAAMLLNTLAMPGEVFLWKNGSTRQLTQTNDAVLGERRLGEVRNVTVQGTDGTDVEAFIYLPPDYQPGRRYPAILHIHGGPVAQYDFFFEEFAHLYAAAGYVAILANPRGSSGYGQDFSAAIFADWGVRDFADVMAVVDYAISQGYADPERLGVGGWSYGGILTNYVITKTDRFAAAISGASEVNYLANYGHDHYQLEWETELGLPWEHRDTWERISPYNNVDKITTPTLVIGGKEDWNVPIQNSEQLYQALRRRGIPTQLVVYPDEPHSISRPGFRKDRFERFLGWYDRYLHD